MRDEQRIGDFIIKSLNLILDSLERHRKRIVLCGIDMAGENHALCAVCGQSPCACGTGHMGEVE